MLDIGYGEIPFDFVRLADREFVNLVRHLERDDTPDGHWIWKGSTDRRGYARMYVNGSRRSVPRITFAMLFGWPPDDWRVVPFCGESRCVRPIHLWAGGMQPHLHHRQRWYGATNESPHVVARVEEAKRAAAAQAELVLRRLRESERQPDVRERETDDGVGHFPEKAATNQEPTGARISASGCSDWR